jgi:hypothetical protein
MRRIKKQLKEFFDNHPLTDKEKEFQKKKKELIKLDPFIYEIPNEDK